MQVNANCLLYHYLQRGSMYNAMMQMLFSTPVTMQILNRYMSPAFYGTARTVASSALAKYSTLPSFSPAIDMRDELAM